MRFGSYLKSLRLENGLSQKELAEKSGVSSAEISRVETGDRKTVSPHFIKAIEPYLGVSHETLLAYAGFLVSDNLDYEKINFSKGEIDIQAGMYKIIEEFIKAIYKTYGLDEPSITLYDDESIEITPTKGGNKKKKNYPLDEALNMGDGTYRP